MKTLKVTETVDSGLSTVKSVSISVDEKDPGLIDLAISSAGTTKTIRIKRERVLDLFTTLWPDEVAYQFKDANV